MRPAHVRSKVKQLQASGHILIDGSTIQVHPACSPLINRAVAVEAKLADWLGGLLQAGRYTRFADQVYLATPPKLARRLDREQVGETGIGVISVGGSSRILVGAKRQPAERPAMRCWCEEAEFASLIGETRHTMLPFTPRFFVPTPDQIVAAASF